MEPPCLDEQGKAEPSADNCDRDGYPPGEEDCKAGKDYEGDAAQRGNAGLGRSEDTAVGDSSTKGITDADCTNPNPPYAPSA